MKRELTTLLVELVIGAVAGTMTYFAIGEADPVGATLSVLVGLTTALLAATVVGQWEQQRDDQRLEARLELVLAKLGDRMADQHELAQLLRHGSLRFGREEVAAVFQQLLWKTQRRYWATSYQSPDELVLHESALAIQGAKAGVEGIDVRRIYLVDSVDEAIEIAPLIARQRAVGIDARWLHLPDVATSPILKDQLDALPTLDFTLVDSHLLWQLELDESRRVEAESLRFDEARVAELESTFRSLLNLAQAESPTREAT